VGPLRALIVVAALAGPASGTPPPRGERAPRPRATDVVIEPAELRAGSASFRVAPGVAAARDGAAVTLLGPVAVTGLLDRRALGARVCREVDARDPASGKTVGRLRPGALVGGRATRSVGALVEPPAPLRGRLLVEPDAAGVADCELVLPVPENALLSATARVPLARRPDGSALLTLEPGARVEPLAAPEGGWQRVRTYGAVAVEGWVPAGRLGPDQGPPPGPTRGLAPTHEALVDTPLFADAGGRRAIGRLRGGALVSVGVEKEGPRVKVMTHGDVVGEAWTALDQLRPLEASVWAEGR
jgi:hypothetical protein